MTYLNEGIIYQGFLLSKEDFIQRFLEEDDVYFKKFQQDIENLVNDIQLHSLTNGEIYQRWDMIQQEYFSGTLLLEIFSENNGTDINFAPIVNEVDIVSQKGYIQSKKMYDQLDAINKIKQAEEFKNLITQHYKQLLTTIENDTLSSAEAKQAHIQQYYMIERQQSSVNQEINYFLQKKKAQRLAKMKTHAKEQFTGKTFREVIYQRMVNQQYEGKVWDAFMNHVGNYHKEIIAALIHPEIIPQLMTTFFSNSHTYANSVYIEEGRHFVKLLYDSLNSTPWFASGDIVIIDNTGRVIYNIQLKTTTNISGTFKLSTKALQTLLKQLVAIGDDRRQIAELLFEKLKTSPSNNIYRQESELENSIYNFVQQQIQLPG